MKKILEREEKISFNKERELKVALEKLCFDYWTETGKVITSIMIGTGIKFESQDFNIEGYITVEPDDDFFI